MSLLSTFTPPWAALGTGLLPLNAASSKVLPSPLPPAIQDAILADLPALFGDYPVESGEVAASALFIALFAILMIAHLFVFFKNKSRGHMFWPTMGMVSLCALKIIGLGLRIQWSSNFLLVRTGIAAVTFTQIPILILLVMNFYLSTRIFTWRHPIAGRSGWHLTVNAVLYCLCIALIVMGIVGQTIPNVYFLTPKHYKMCQQVVQAASVLQIVYAMNGVFNVCNAYLVKPGKIDEKFIWGNHNRTPDQYARTLQPTWIEKYSTFYYVPKGSTRRIYKDEPDAESIRLINTAETPGGGLIQSQNIDYGNPAPSIKSHIAIIVFTSFMLVISSILRCVATFKNGPRGGSGVPMLNGIFHSWVFYVFYCGFEVILVTMWLVLRIDLRFYQPDQPKTRGPSDPLPEVVHHSDGNSIEKKYNVSHEESV